jgi:hypothetical protein
MKIVIGTNIFGNYKRQDIARDSWIHLQQKHPEVVFHAVQFEHEKQDSNTGLTEYQDFKIDPIFGLTRSAKSFIPDATRELPVLKDILDILYQKYKDDTNVTHIGYVNSDCMITSTLIDHLHSNEVKALAVSRMDIQPVESFKQVRENGVSPTRIEIAGFDSVIFSKRWWEEHNHLINNYIIGQPYYDQVLAGIISVTGGTIYNDSKKPILCHVQHDIKWMDDTPEKRWNDQMLKSNPFDHLCFNIIHFHLQYNLVKRKPFGAFIQPEKDETGFTRAFFDTLSLKTDNKLLLPKQ